jgi:hypothetical protein
MEKEASFFSIAISTQPHLGGKKTTMLYATISTKKMTGKALIYH